MFRFSVLAVLCLGLLTACEPTESKVPAPEVSRASQSSALTTLVVPLKWSGAGGTCFASGCGDTGAGYACSNNPTWNNGQVLFMDPVPSGGVVVKAEARVYGRHTSGSLNVLDVPVHLNTFLIGTFQAIRYGCTGTCDAPQPVTNSDANGIPGYVYGGTNVLRLPVVGSSTTVYCVSHAELALTIAEPRIQVSPATLNFGNQKPGTTSVAQKVTVTNTGDANLRLDSLTISPPFSVSGTVPPVSILPGASRDIAVSFSPTTVGSATGTLSLKSNDATRPQAVVNLVGTGGVPMVEVSPTAIDFGEQQVGSRSAARPVTVRNSGSAPLTVSALASFGPFTVNATVPFTLAPNDLRVLDVAFTPTTVGTVSGHLTVTTDDPDRTNVTVILAGTGVKPMVALSASTMDFGAQRVGTVSPARTVVVTNTGTGTLLVNSVSINGPFAVSPNSALSVAPKESIALTVVFSPTASGNVQGSLALTTNDMERPTVTVALVGSGVKPNLVLTPGSLAFGDVRVGTSRTQMVTVSNSGTGPITFTNINLNASAAFTLVSPPSLPFSLAPGAAQAFTVKYSPVVESVVQEAGALSFTTTDPDYPSLTVELSGRGVKPNLVVDPSPLAFGEVRVNTDVTKVVTVRNTGTGPITLTSMTLTGSAAFTLVNPPASALTLAAGDAQVFTVRFRSIVEASEAGTLSFATDSPDQPGVTVSLMGKGVRPNLVLSPIALAFGEVRVGTELTRTVTVSNSGTGPIIITAVTKSGSAAFALVNAPAGSFTLAAGTQQVLSVKYSPTVEAAETGVLTLASNDPEWLDVTVSLAGKGVKPVIVLSTTSIAFGDQALGSTSPPRVVTVRNDGSGTARITALSVIGPFTLSPTGPFDLPAATSRDLSVTFSPTANGQASGTLTLTTDDPTTPTVNVSLAGFGGKPVLTLNPTSLSFAAQAVGTTSPPMVVTVSNTGTSTLRVISLRISNTFFAVSPSTAFDLEPGMSKDLLVTFTANTQVGVTGSLTLTSNDPVRPNSTVALSGLAATARAQLTLPNRPNEFVLDFGELRANTSKTEVVRLTNVGSAPLNLTRATLSSGVAFSIVGSSTVTLEPGTFTDFLVSFNPTAKVSYSDVLVFESNATNSPSRMSVMGRGTLSEAQVEQTSLFFGDVGVGAESVAIPVRLINAGTGALTVQSLIVEGPFSVTYTPGPFRVPFGLQQNQFVNLLVVFKPTAQGLATGSLTVVSDAGVGSSLTVALQGKGTVAAAKLSATSLDFGSQRVLETSTAQPLLINNTGGAELEIRDFVSSNGVFASTAVLPLKIAPGQTKSMSVTFTPRALGTASGSLSIVSNASETPAPVSLTGKGIDGQVSVTPGTVAFGSVEVGTSGTQLVVAFSNIGEVPLTIIEVVRPVETSFAVSGLQAGLVVNPGEQRSFTVSFAPSRRGYVADTVILKTDARINPTYNLSVSGTGIAPAVELLPTDIHFGKLNVGGTARQSIAIKNVGERDLYVSNLSFVDVAAGAPGAALDFAFEAVLPLVVKPGESTLVPLKFTPLELGPRQARVIVYTNDKAVEANLVGEGTSSNLVVDPVSLDFGSSLVGIASASRVVRLTNTGTGSLLLTSMTLAGADATAFTLSSPGLPLSLQPGTTREVTVVFWPDAVRSFSARLGVASNDVNMPSVTVPLSGSGVSQQLELSTSLVEFGQQLISHRSSPRKVRVTNNSAFNATLTSLTVLGAGATQFSLEGLVLPLVLAPGQAQELGVTFTPRAEGEVTSTLKLSFRESSSQPEVGLRGRGIPKAFSIQPSPLDFGTVRAGGSKREQPLTLTNLTSETIVLAAPERVSSTGEAFLFDGAALAGRTIPPNESIIVPVGYQPMVETLSEATLSFGTTTPAQPRAVEVQLKGKATLRLLSAAPGSLDFGRVDVGATVEAKVVTVTNKSSQPQRVVVKLKAQGTPFTVDTSTLAEAIPAGGSATFKVAFQPQTEGEAQSEVEVWLQGETEAEALIPVKGVGQGGTDPEPPGGCSCGSTEAGSAGMLALLALVGLGSRRRRRA